MKDRLQFRYFSPLSSLRLACFVFFACSAGLLGQQIGHSRTALLPYWKGCDDGANCQTVILVHGIHGTKTSDVPVPCGLFDYLDSSSTALTNDCNWGPLLKHLEGTDLWGKLRIYVFRYESDKASTTSDLGRMLLDQMEARKFNHVILIAHSMGGLVTRSMMAAKGATTGEAGLARVRAVITLATPHHGTPFANREWRNELAQRLKIDISDFVPGDILNKYSYTLNCYDDLFWDVAKGSPHLAKDSSRPNRSDLVWDNWNGMFSTQKSEYPEYYWEENISLATTASPAIARRLICYGGTLQADRMHSPPLEYKGGCNEIYEWMISTQPGNPKSDAEAVHGFLEATAYEMKSRLNVTIGSDGLVPLDSALLLGNHHVGLRRGDFHNYDHMDMMGVGPEDGRVTKNLNKDLFSKLANDLDQVIQWGGVPPRLVGVTATPDPAVSGSTIQLNYSVKTAFSESTRILLKASVNGVSYCGSADVGPSDSADVESGSTPGKLYFQLPTGLGNSFQTITMEILPKSASCNGPAGTYDVTTKDLTIQTIPAVTYSDHPLPGSVLQPPGEFGPFQHGTRVSASYDVATGNRLGIGLRGAILPVGCIVDLVHAGSDIVAPEGTPIFAIADGLVQDLIDSPADQNFSSLGYMVLLKHNQLFAGKSTYSLYLHMSAKPSVSRNQSVVGRQTKLGTVGSTGLTSGAPQLHIEVRHFPDRFYSGWNNLLGVERATCGKTQTFDEGSFAKWWSDPAQFSVALSSSTTPAPTISLTIGTPAKREYKVGESIQLVLGTTSGAGAGQTATPPIVSTFLYREGPDGTRFVVLDNMGQLFEKTSATPVSSPMPAIDYAMALTPIQILPSSPKPGTYSWRAELHNGELFSPSNRIAMSSIVSYAVLSERSPLPSVMSISTGVGLYKPGDTMVINYSITKGTDSKTYDLMLRLTSRATGKDYYFYDNKADSNRWIHSAPRFMIKGIPVDGNSRIPSDGAEPIVIETNMPSGEYAMYMYFSEPDKNVPSGGIAQSVYRLETPTPEGGCFVATAAFGSPMATAVRSLREFRDKILLASELGRRFVDAYYRFGPRFAFTLAPRPWLRKIVRIALWPVVAFGVVAVGEGPWFALLLFIGIAAGICVLWQKTPLAGRLLLILVLMSAASFAAQIRGTVIRSKPFPAPVAGAKVEIQNTNSIATTDQYGRFRFDGLSVREHTVRASASGFISGSVQVSITSATSSPMVVVALAPVGSRTYEYYLPHTAETGGWWTFFVVLNPNQTTAQVSMDAYNSKGTYLETSTKIGELAIGRQVMGAPSGFFPSEIIAQAAYFKLTASAPITGFEMFGQTTGTMAAFPLTTAQSEAIYLPHVAEDTQWWTGVSFVSGSVQTEEFHLEARDRTGNLLVEGSNVVALRPGEKTVDVLSNYFGWDFPEDISWARMRSGGPITGFELFGTKDFKMLAAVPAFSAGLRRFFFPHVATSDGFWTGIAMLNTQELRGAALINAHAGDGRILATSRTIPLDPWERTVGVVQDYFDSWPNSVEYLAVTADVDLVAFELVGRFQPALFGGLPAMPPLGATIAFPYTISTQAWDTSLGILNTSSAATTVVLEAMNTDGSKRGSVQFSLAAKGARSGTLRALFGTVPTGTSWIRASSSNGASLSGFLKLSRTGTGEFTDIPAVAVIPAGQVGGQSAVQSSSLSEASAWAAISALASRVNLSANPGGGVRITWPDALEEQIRRLTAGNIMSGDIVLSVENMTISSDTDLWTAYMRFRSVPEVTVLVRRHGVPSKTIRVRNPWVTPE